MAEHTLDAMLDALDQAHRIIEAQTRPRRPVKFHVGTYAITDLSTECGPGGSGQCDGFCEDGSHCDCGCHDGGTFLWRLDQEDDQAEYPNTIEGYRLAHEAQWVKDPEGNWPNVYAPNGVTPVYGPD